MGLCDSYIISMAEHKIIYNGDYLLYSKTFCKLLIKKAEGGL